MVEDGSPVLGRPKIYKSLDEAHTALRKCQRAFYHRNKESIRVYQFKMRFKKKRGREPNDEELQKFHEKRARQSVIKQ